MSDRLGHACVLVLLLAPRICPAQSPSPASAPAWTRIDATTYEQRQEALARACALEGRSLVLPFAHAARRWPPRIAAPGDAIGPAKAPWLAVERVLPEQEIHGEYLAQRIALARDGVALVDWCREQGQDECAEFEAARRMDEIDDFQKPEYARYLERWLALRDHEQIDVSLPLPLEGEWFVLVDETKHHRKKAYAAYAFDIVRKVDGKVCRGTGSKLEDFYGFDKPIVAQADGVVIDVDNDFPDMAPGKLGGFEEANCVIVDYGGGILGSYAHCRQGSAAVQPGDRVVQGQRLASVGSSGASGMPHLHFSIIDRTYYSIRGRFHGEVKRGTRWVPFAGTDLEPGTYVRNAAAKAKTAGR